MGITKIKNSVLSSLDINEKTLLNKFQRHSPTHQSVNAVQSIGVRIKRKGNELSKLKEHQRKTSDVEKYKWI